MNDGQAVTTSSAGSSTANERCPITASAPAAVITCAGSSPCRSASAHCRWYAPPSG